MNPGTINKNLLGALSFKRFVEAHGGVLVVASHPEGRIFRGADAERALRAEGFDVAPWPGPRDANVSNESWARWVRRCPSRIALRPIGKVGV